MARLPKDVIVTSRPVQTFPNGDYLYVELSRTNSHYDCFVKMARSGNPENACSSPRRRGKRSHEAEDKCYMRALDRSPRLPPASLSQARIGASRTQSNALSRVGTGLPPSVVSLRQQNCNT